MAVRPFLSASSAKVIAIFCHAYLITARHCIQRAKRYGNLFLRLNTHSGSAELIDISNLGWVYPNNEATDIAVSEHPFEPDQAYFDAAPIPDDMFHEPELLKSTEVGIGDEIIIAGLFRERRGEQRNVPIVRSGILAAMPDEPLMDNDTGLPYDAYLAEVRSLGGLSGSPVVVACGPARLMQSGAIGIGLTFFLLGVIRGHWDYQAPEMIPSFVGDDLSQVNMGIAIVTPFEEARRILYSEEFIKDRRTIEKDGAIGWAQNQTAIQGL